MILPTLDLTHFIAAIDRELSAADREEEAPSMEPGGAYLDISFEAYQDAVDDLTTLMRARIGEYELKLDHANLRADEIMTRARLLYLQGEAS